MDQYGIWARASTRSAIEAPSKSGVGRRGLPIRPVGWKAQLPSRSIPTSTARSVTSSSQSISSSAKVRLCGTVEVGEHQDLERIGAGSRTEGVEALAERLLQLLEGREAGP